MQKKFGNRAFGIQIPIFTDKVCTVHNINFFAIPDGVQDFICVQVQDPDRRRSNVLRLLQPQGRHLLQAITSSLSGTQPRSEVL